LFLCKESFKKQVNGGAPWRGFAKEASTFVPEHSFMGSLIMVSLAARNYNPIAAAFSKTD
jgi:hypothetical protein